VVDKMMCSTICNCRVEVMDTWTSIPEKKLRIYERVAFKNQQSIAEQREVIERGPYDSSTTPLTFGYPYIQNFTQCYQENIKPVFEKQERLPEDL
jgi:hypothetical protein